MQKSFWLYCFFILSIGLGSVTVAQADNIDDLQLDIKKLQQRLNEFKNQRSQLTNELQHSEQQISSIQRKVRSLENNIQQQSNKIERLKTRRSELNKAKQQQQQAVEKQLSRAYQMGRQQKIKILLNQQDPAEISRMMVYYDYLSRANIAQIDDYNTTIQRLTALEDDLATSRKKLISSQHEVKKQHNKLKQQQLSRRQTLAKIDKTIVSKDSELKREQKQLEQLLSAVAENINDIAMPDDYRSFIDQKGKMVWPVKGRLINSFNSRRNAAGLRWHGLNIAARSGTEVRAIHRGRVVFADWFSGLGMLIILDHGDGYLSLYAHNQAIFPAAGDWINAADTIATVGNSGGQKQPSLYLEIRHNGTPINPKKWLK